MKRNLLQCLFFSDTECGDTPAGNLQGRKPNGPQDASCSEESEGCHSEENEATARKTDEADLVSRCFSSRTTPNQIYSALCLSEKFLTSFTCQIFHRPKANGMDMAKQERAAQAMYLGDTLENFGEYHHLDLSLPQTDVSSHFKCLSVILRHPNVIPGNISENASLDFLTASLWLWLNRQRLECFFPKTRPAILSFEFTQQLLRQCCNGFLFYNFALFSSGRAGYCSGCCRLRMM